MPRYRVIMTKDVDDLLEGVAEVEADDEDAAELIALRMARDGEVEFAFKAIGPDSGEAAVDSIEEIAPDDDVDAEP